jgi:phosphatidylglycerol---prolipoprotein diacylglyceryl transferase
LEVAQYQTVAGLFTGKGPAWWPVLMRFNAVGALLGAGMALALLQAQEDRQLPGMDTWAQRADALVPALLGAMLCWRAGCLLAGLSIDAYGNPTSLPWGINFGDGIIRHPAPLYEIGFLLFYGWAVREVADENRRALERDGTTWLRAGDVAALFFLGYWVWRFTADFGKPPHYSPTLYTELMRAQAPLVLGITATQWACLVGIGLALPKWWRIVRALVR